MTLTIRQLRESDFDYLFNEVSRQHGEHWLKRQAEGEVYVAVAEWEGVPVGRIGLDFTSHADLGAGYIFSAHVEGDYQSRGIGTAIIAHLEKIAVERGFKHMRLMVGKDNPRAQALYERLGYQFCGEAVGRWNYHDGEKVVEVVEDNWVMCKTT
jgi:ribosomal protein S18 acetylase RimI-like enzyme